MHKNAEISDKEFQTTLNIFQFLKTLGIEDE